MPSHFPLVPLLVCFPKADFSFILYESLWIKLFEIKFVIRHLRFSILRMRFAFLRDFILVDLLKICTIKPGPREFKIILKFLKKMTRDEKWSFRTISNPHISFYELNLSPFEWQIDRADNVSSFSSTISNGYECTHLIIIN